MPVWAQIILGVITLAREMVKLYREKEADKKKAKIAAVNKINEMSKALNKARTEGKTDDIEKAIADLKLPAKSKPTA